MERHCVGVDGARHAWLAVWEYRQGLVLSVYEKPSMLWAEHRDAVIAVDIPIGLTEQGPRMPDVEARRFVGRRRASIFPSPVRGVLDATTQPEASLRHRAIDGRGLGVQSFAILPKIRVWDDLLVQDAEVRSCVYEVHPEVSFAALNEGVGLAERKKSTGGALARQKLLNQEFGADRVQALLAKRPRGTAAPDDVLDALAALWTARRIAVGTALTLPATPLVDSMGLRMAIHY